MSKIRVPSSRKASTQDQKSLVRLILGTIATRMTTSWVQTDPTEKPLVSVSADREIKT